MTHEASFSAPLNVRQDLTLPHTTMFLLHGEVRSPKNSGEACSVLLCCNSGAHIQQPHFLPADGHQQHSAAPGPAPSLPLSVSTWALQTGSLATQQNPGHPNPHSLHSSQEKAASGQGRRRGVGTELSRRGRQMDHSGHRCGWGMRTELWLLRTWTDRVQAHSVF